MGAAASVEGGSMALSGAVDRAHNSVESIGDGANAAQRVGQNSDAVNSYIRNFYSNRTTVPTGGSTSINVHPEGAFNSASAGVRQAVNSLMSVVPSDLQAMVTRLCSSCAQKMDELKFTEALNAAKDAADGLQGAAIFAAIGGAFVTVSALAPDVCAVTADFLTMIGPHMPMIGVAAGILGAFLYTLKMSIDNDANVRAVAIWSASVKDWLILIASRVNDSGADSTVPLFIELKERLEELVQEFQRHKEHWRITKMLMASNFQQRFNLVKNSVLELKTALRDYLNQEQQDQQDRMLRDVMQLQLHMTEKLDNIDTHLHEIKSLIIDQLANNHNSNGTSSLQHSHSNHALNHSRSKQQLGPSENVITNRKRECPVCYEALYKSPVAFICDESDGKPVCTHMYHIQCVTRAPVTNRCAVCNKHFDLPRPLPNPLTDPWGWFQTVDCNDNGHLTFDEITYALRAQLPLSTERIDADAQALWGHWDVDKSGRVSMNEFTNKSKGLITYLTEHYPRDNNTARELPDITKDKQAWFAYWDEDNTDKLDKFELCRALIKTLKLLDIDQTVVYGVVHEIWPLFDVDGSGVISKSEFCSEDNFGDTIIAQLGHMQRTKR